MQHIVVFDHYLIFTFKGEKEGPETYRPASPTSIPEVVGERWILETISRHVKDKKMMGVVSTDLWFLS